MKKQLVLMVAVGLVMALLVGGVALAQEATPPAGDTPTAQAPCGMAGNFGERFGGFGGFGFGKGDWTLYDKVAETLKLTPTGLFEQLHSGKTLAEIAAAQGVDMATIQDVVKTTRQEAQRAAIEQAVTNGKITREQADWMLQGLENGWGFGGPMGRMGGMGRGGHRGGGMAFPRTGMQLPGGTSNG